MSIAAKNWLNYPPHPNTTPRWAHGAPVVVVWRLAEEQLSAPP